MSHIYSVHPVNPEKRLLQKAVAIVKQNGLVVFPTDSGYCIGCKVGSAAAVKRIRALRGLDNNHKMTLMLPDLTDIGLYVRVMTPHYRMIKTLLPGHYTFILPATKAIPRLMVHPKRKEIGIRVPDNNIALSLLHALDQPLISSTLSLPDADEPLGKADAIQDLLGAQVDLILDGGQMVYYPTSVINLCQDQPEIIRAGAGDLSFFQ